VFLTFTTVIHHTGSFWSRSTQESGLSQKYRKENEKIRKTSLQVKTIEEVIKTKNEQIKFYLKNTIFAGCLKSKLNSTIGIKDSTIRLIYI